MTDTKVAPSKGGSTASTAPVGPGRPADPGTVRTVRLSLARIDPWSVMKIAFLLSVAFGIAAVVATFLLWSVVKGMGTFDQVNEFVRELSKNSSFDVAAILGLPRVMAFSTLIAVANVVLMTALATLTALLYNICAALVGGLTSTFSDD